MPALQVVVFYCEAPGRNRVVAGDLPGVEQIALLYRSAQAVNRDVGLTVLTSPETDLSGLSFAFERVDDTVDFDRLMFERTRMQRQYVERRPAASPLAFLDSDILFAKDLMPLFAEDFDVALTWRDDREMPFNGGVIFANNRRPAAVAKFFAELEAIYRDRQGGRLEWYGDQYALTELVGLPAEAVAGTTRHASRDIRFCFLPCDRYNVTPSANPLSLLRGTGDAVLLHFKGVARRLMRPFWTFWLDPARRGARWPGLAATAIKLAVTRRAYRHQVNRDQRRFNLDTQDSRGWRERAELAGALIARIGRQPLDVADIGCGDCKLEEALRDQGLAFAYRGYDLLPQTPSVRPLDLASAEIPEPADVVVSLGVLEYVEDTRAALGRMYRAAPWLVISHSARDLRKLGAETVRRLKWRTHLSSGEFEGLLNETGYRIVAREVTPNRKTMMWLCRRAGAQDFGA